MMDHSFDNTPISTITTWLQGIIHTHHLIQKYLRCNLLQRGDILQGHWLNHLNVFARKQAKSVSFTSFFQYLKFSRRINKLLFPFIEQKADAKKLH